MTTIAVIGAAEPVGQALLERLDADARVDRILGIDCDEPAMPVAKLEFRTGEVRDRLLPLAVEGADVVVHLGLDERPETGEDERFARNVHGTRNVLRAVAAVGASRYVHLSSAAVYGAHSDNALPLRETAPLRANPDFATAYHHLLAEELVEDFAEEHPATRVVVLRPATVLGHGVDHVLARHLLAPRLLTVADSEPPLQFLHLDDLAAALHLAALDDLSGPYNVAADGWLAADELSTVLGRRRLAVPEAVAFGLTRGLFSRHLASIPPGALHYLMHPTVVTSTRAKAAGWVPSRSNREILREFAADHHGELRLGRIRLRSRDVVTAGATGAAAMSVLALLFVRSRWQRRLQERGQR